MSEEDLCRRNREGVEEERRDDRPRRVDHLIAFLREETALRFAEHVVAKNYGVDGIEVADGHWRVRFFRYDPPCDMDAVTLDLLRDARDFGGTYERGDKAGVSV